MVKSDIISEAKANRLFWLGRYLERVYISLHILRKCYDKMIDGEPKDYEDFWSVLDAGGNYSCPEEFRLGMMYDETNPCSIVSELNCAKDNAILLREDLMSETLSYVELCNAHMRKCASDKVTNITLLQPITDWTLAFWGSTMQRVSNPKVLMIMLIGKHIEEIDMLTRFNYPMERISFVFAKLKKISEQMKELFNEEVKKELDDVLSSCQYTADVDACKKDVLRLINQLSVV